MPSTTKEIKERMVATSKTMKITKAMNMVSASKMKSSEKAILEYTDYLKNIEKITKNVLNSKEAKEANILSSREIKNVLAVVVTSDKGLAGPYNSSIIKELKTDINNASENYTVLSIGVKGYNAAKRLKCELIEDYLYSKDEVDILDVKKAILTVLDLYNENKIDKVVVYYNHYVNTLTQEVKKHNLLPISYDEESVSTYEYEQKLEDIVDTVLEVYFENVLYGILLDAKASEHASRMTAMSSATDNATALIGELEIQYNRARQSQITLELIDIISGSNALN